MADGEEIVEIKKALKRVRRKTAVYEEEDTRLPLPEEIKAEYTQEEHTKLEDCLAEFYEGIVGTPMLIGMKDKQGGEEILPEEFVGQGNMAGVFRAKRKGHEDSIALKVLSPYLSRFPGFVDRFDDEGRTMIELPYHPNLVAGILRGVDKRNTFDFAFGKGAKKIRLYAFGMEFIEGKPLDEIMKENARTPPPELAHLPPFLTGIDPMPIKYSCDIILQVAEALKVAHKHDKLHRDIKPANIIITKDGVAKLTDFGMVKEFGAADRTTAGLTVGTPLYMSPDQVVHDFYYTSDLCSLAIVLYQMVTGELPFKGLDKNANYSDDRLVRQIMNDTPIPPRNLNPQVSARLQQAILRAMDKRVDYRHLNVGEFVEEMTMICKKTFNDDVQTEWRKNHEKDTTKTRVFDLLFSSPFVNLSEEVLGTQREIIYECEEIEQESLEKQVEDFDLNAAGLGTKIRAAKDFEELIRRTPRTKATAKKRWNWIKTRRSIYTKTEKNKPEFRIDKTSAQYQLNFEEKMMRAWNVPKPDERKWLDKYKWWCIGSAMAGLLLLSTALGLHAIFEPRARERREAEARAAARQIGTEAFDQQYSAARFKILKHEFGGLEKEIDSLDEQAIKLDDPERKGKVKDITALFGEKKEEHRLNKHRDNTRAMVKEAYALIDAIKDEKLGKEERDEKLNKAKTLADAVKKAAGEFSGAMKDEFIRESGVIAGRIGPQFNAFEVFDGASNKYKEAAETYNSLKAEWEKDNALAHTRVAILREQIKKSEKDLLAVKRDFTDEDSGKTTERYDSLVDAISVLEAQLVELHSDVSNTQFYDAETAFWGLRNIVKELKQDNAYLAENAAQEDAKAAVLEAKITKLLGNVEGSIFVGKSRLKFLKSDLKALMQDYPRDKIRDIAVGKTYFKEKRYAESLDLFKKALGNKKIALEHNVNAYIRVGSLEMVNGNSLMITPQYSADELSGLKTAIKTYKTEMKGEMIILECLKKLNKTDCSIDTETWGENYEEEYLAVLHKKDVTAPRKKTHEFLDSVWQKALGLVKRTASDYVLVGFEEEAAPYKALLASK